MAVNERLRYARERCALSGAKVTERTGIGGSSLSELESGKRAASLSQLTKLAELYRRPITFFLEDSALPAEPPVLWKQRPEVDAENIESHFVELCAQYHNLEIWTNETSQDCLIETHVKANEYKESNAEELAKHFRDELQLGDRPGQGLLAVVEEVCGVKVFHLDIDPAGTAASIRSQTYGAAVLLNSKNPRWRRNEELAHELFHLLTWHIFHPTPDAVEAPTSVEEQFADYFALNLLMPIEPFRTAINSKLRDGAITLSSLYDVAREFDVSVEAVIVRMHKLYSHVDTSHEHVKKDVARAKELETVLERRKDGPKPPQYPERYRALAVNAFRNGEMSTGRFAKYLNISRQEAHKFEQEVPDGEEVHVAPA